MPRHAVSPLPVAGGQPPWMLVQESVVHTQRHWLDAFQGGYAPEVESHRPAGASPDRSPNHKV